MINEANNISKMCTNLIHSDDISNVNIVHKISDHDIVL